MREACPGALQAMPHFRPASAPPPPRCFAATIGWLPADRTAQRAMLPASPGNVAAGCAASADFCLSRAHPSACEQRGRKLHLGTSSRPAAWAICQRCGVEALAHRGGGMGVRGFCTPSGNSCPPLLIKLLPNAPADCSAAATHLTTTNLHAFLSHLPCRMCCWMCWQLLPPLCRCWSSQHFRTALSQGSSARRRCSCSGRQRGRAVTQRGMQQLAQGKGRRRRWQGCQLRRSS